MVRFFVFLAWLLREFGSLAVFYSANHFLGIRWAIVLSTLYSFAELARRLFLKQPLTAIFKFSAGMTVLFGAVDLWLTNPVMFKYEAAVSNLMSAAFFGASLAGRRSIIQEFYEKRPGAVAMTPTRIRFFRLCTLVWVAYFAVKAVLFAWMAHTYGLEKTLLLRVILGSSSFYALFGLSIFGGPPIYRALLARGWLGTDPSAPARR